MKKIITATLLAASFSAFAQDPVLAPFYHGVASGDALSDRVIIWTRVTPAAPTGATLDLSWKMATDTLLTQVVQSGVVSTDSSKDYTVKIDVTGLQPDSWYYYQFTYNGKKSLTGRTKTLPVGNNQRVRLAVTSCQSYNAGVYYNAWLGVARRNDIHAVLQLGDYIYEGSGGGPTGAGIAVLPNHEIVTLQDYRQRYNSYRLDPFLRRAHQQYPFYTVWDDHEVANNAWENGSSGHDPGTEGDYMVRKAQAQRAYFEWLPIRQQAPGDYSVYRTLNFGNLADLIMLDTRHEGRDEQVSAANNAALQDTSRTILGVAQRQWFFDELENSQATWRIIGQQVMMAPLRLGTIYFTADQWDGYQGDRNRLIDHVIGNNISNVVVLTGDIHSSWANDIPQEGVTYNPSTGAGSAFVEFVTPSISSGGLPSALSAIIGILLSADPYIKWSEVTTHGYILVDIDSSRVHSDWYFTSTTTSASFTESVAASWQVNNGERFLRQASAPSTGFANAAPLAPLTIDTTCPAIAINIVSTMNVSNCVAPDGSAVVLASGGTNPYSYSWSNGQTSDTATGLVPGIYNISATDQNGCEGIATVTIADSTRSPAVGASATNETSEGADDGTATATVTGGTPAYSYSWNTGSTDQTINGLSAGTYLVTVTDQLGCSGSASATVQAGSVGLNDVSNLHNISLFPNPANDMVTLKLELTEVQDVSVSWHNASGMTMAETIFPAVKSLEKQFDFTSFPQGNYLVRIKAGTEEITRSVTLAK